jgi:[acyl-carrier-protein] S-malonyltransferase
MAKERIVVICPGRGSYSRETSGYLKEFKHSGINEVEWMDQNRTRGGLPSITDLDSKPFKSNLHMRGEHAAPLIYACSLVDFISIDQDKYEIVAITGNSMGWYIALALGGALSKKKSYHLISTMGSMMKEKIIGSQIIYPIIDENWLINLEKKSIVEALINKADAYISIILGGYYVIGGSQKAINILLEELPTDEKYPFQLPFHAAFHTPLLETISEKAIDQLPLEIFKKPDIPLVDGRGHIWSPYSTNVAELWDYTLRDQVTNTFDFSSSISVTLKEFCPDKLVLLGPGNSLGGVIGQIIIQNKWKGVSSKKEFSVIQGKNPFLISLGLKDQRKIIC